MRNRLSFDFTDASVLVTGGTSGIGYAISCAFADAGAVVTVTGTRSSAAEYETDLSRFAYRQLEMRDGGSIDALAAELGTLDVLVNNAGANFPDGLDEWSPEGFSASLAMNVEGAQRLSVRARGVLAQSRMEGGASVVNVISMMTYRATTIVPGYSSSKAALLALTRNLALHWVNDGIRVNAVAPGPIWTPLIPSTFPEEKVSQFGADTPMKRAGQPAEVAPSYVFLASADSSYMSGQVLHINSGEITNG